MTADSFVSALRYLVRLLCGGRPDARCFRLWSADQESEALWRGLFRLIPFHLGLLGRQIVIERIPNCNFMISLLGFDKRDFFHLGFKVIDVNSNFYSFVKGKRSMQ